MINCDKQSLEVGLNVRYAGFPVAADGGFARTASHVFNSQRAGASLSYLCQNSRCLKILVPNLRACVLRCRRRRDLWDWHCASCSSLMIGSVPCGVVHNMNDEGTGSPLPYLKQRKT